MGQKSKGQNKRCGSACVSALVGVTWGDTRAKRPCELRKLGVITITGPLTNTPAPNYCVSCDPANYYGNGRPSSGPAPPTPRPPDQVGKYAAEQS